MFNLANTANENQIKGARLINDLTETVNQKEL